jgi:hypothetical protein
MKRFILSFLLSFLLVAQVCLANDTSIPGAVLSSFTSRFQNAQSISWSDTKDYYKVSFCLNAETYCAFYTREGSFVALSRQIPVTQLPLLMQQGLYKKYGAYTVSSVVEFEQDDIVSYYAEITSEKNNLIVKAGSTGEWNEFLKTRKK